MAETTTGSSSSSSPIMNLPQDHLFTILLFLPVDSILSFSMTCKRFNSWTCFDSLWESICRRDWGSISVDALKSSTNTQQLPWMRLYKQLSRLDSVSCRKLADLDPQSFSPNPRASHSLNFVSDYLVIFGGGCEGGRHLDDTWAAYVGNDFPRTFKWQKLVSGVPSGRFGHTCITIGHNLVLFGGINDCGIRQNDTWIGQVFRDNLHISLSWRLLYGGEDSQRHRKGDFWVLDISSTLSNQV